MTKSTIACPLCKKSTTVHKVSTIYLEGAEKHANVRAFAPPSGERQLLRSINPDMTIIIFGAISIFLMIQIAQTQKAALLPAIVIMMVAALLYMVFRKKIIGKYHQQVLLTQQTNERVQRAVGAWMKMYYCDEDKIVFKIGEKQAVPLEEMQSYLYK